MRKGIWNEDCVKPPSEESEDAPPKNKKSAGGSAPNANSTLTRVVRDMYGTQVNKLRDELAEAAGITGSAVLQFYATAMKRFIANLSASKRKEVDAEVRRREEEGLTLEQKIK